MQYRYAIYAVVIVAVGIGVIVGVVDDEADVQ